MIKCIIITALLAAVATVLTGCGSVNPSGSGIAKLELAMEEGPEDLDILFVDGKERLIISSSNYRSKESNGHIWLLNEVGDKIEELPTDLPTNGTSTTIFRPHGIHVVQNDQGEQLVYVVNHASEGDKIQAFTHELGKLKLADEWTVVPTKCGKPKNKLNDVFALPNGRIYTTQLNPGRIWHFDPKDKETGWQSKATALFSNGIHVQGNELYISSGMPGKICHLSLKDGLPSNKAKGFTKLPGGLDNFGQYSGGDYLIASHARQLGFFLKSFRIFSWVYSPTRVYRVDFGNKDRKKELLLKNGNKCFPIQTGSTALKLGDHVYIGQVFDNYLLKIHTDEIVEVDL